MKVDGQQLRGWIGRTETREDKVTATPLAALSATLDRSDPPPRTGDQVPLLWHWLYFLPIHRQSDLGVDGHARLGGFLPPVPLPRRMYAGGSITVHRPLLVGEAISRDSRIADVSCKEGRSGPLVFVKVRHDISDREGLLLAEEHDIVYRDAPRPGESAPPIVAAPSGAQWSREIRPDEALLFRYSALTFNGHRIHYDRRFATEEEGYPGLVVHGPLIATLLVDLLRRNLPAAQVSTFSFRAVRPLFDTASFLVCGRQADAGGTVRLWAQEMGGALALEATAALATGVRS
jgi:3-methylfumaryl-CoA hydratase